MDEPNSNLDREGEEALAAAIRTAKAAGTTVILIAHRPNIMEDVDKVLVINRGQQELFGPRDAVLAELATRAGKVSQMPRMRRSWSRKSDKRKRSKTHEPVRA